MGAASESLAQIVSEASNICPGRTDGAETHHRRREVKHFELFYLDLDRSNRDTAAFPGQFVGGHSSDLLRGKWRRDLRQFPGKRSHRFFDLPRSPQKRALFACRRTLTIVRIRRESETDLADVLFRRMRNE